MLDIKVIRTETERVKKALARRKEVVDIDALLALDNERREALFEVEKKKNAQNEESKKIPLLKKEGKDVSAIFEDMKKLSAEIKEYDEKIRNLDDKIYKIMLTIPNIPADDVPDGETDEDNVEVR
ncbi:MAG: serine--tRNA ligase, partial [Clostridia bacterium]|nr:serine--tRNA ligase [Clostridia bacterium]